MTPTPLASAFRAPRAAHGFLAALCLGLGACASPPPAPVAPDAPTLVLESFFSGRSAGRGEFSNSWSGNKRGFDVTIEGNWDGTTLTLVEDFSFDDGQKERKTWHLRRTGPGTYTGTRDDIVGEARAWTEGPVVRLEYSLLLDGWTVNLSDVLALRSDGTLVNDATVGKWGLRVGRIHLTLTRAGGS